MKRKTLTKTFFILLTSCCLFSCINFQNDVIPEESYQIKVIDSCEYIYVSRRPWGTEFSLTHKGNCKYCTERAKRNLNVTTKKK